ncbi:DMT family transporter [Sphingobium subterraneum]|uniref:Drug/metabolite transporter (DMT)-like permease n=1 Tax=Sphingobium subterraneum TaxID=627688 RepID=A0A841J690_9SPHN|nr:DMT family transporter [Sphingobium subterraneum]MBB6125046.1 drug/metabolite transporter (DMT)-like permease [Sphingobium subterraneum]
MTLGIGLLVLLAAVLHASWNALLRAGSDRLWSMTVMCIAIAIACAILALIVPMPARASWGYAVFSAVLHVGYNLFLVRTYRSGDLGQTYPISRGSSPLLVSLGAAIFAGELPDPISAMGVLMVSAAILSLAFQGGKVGLGSLPYALGTGCFIGAYSVTDGISVRLSGTAVGYTVWMSLLWGVMAPLVYVAIRDWRSLIRGPSETWLAAGGGIVSLIAYGIIIHALSLGAMGPVSALRETSVVFAALIGRFFLQERLTAYRITACIVVAMGAICIGHAGGGIPSALNAHILRPNR